MNPAKQFTTQGIVLSRTEYGEADRIIKFLTPDHGKLSAMAKSVRKSKSKLAGGIELFSVSDLSFVAGRGEIYTLISARLYRHFSNIVKDIERTTVGYELINLINKATADEPEEAYFKLLCTAFEALDNPKLDARLVAFWHNAQLIKQAGHSPNLHTDTSGAKLTPSDIYSFDLDRMQFMATKSKHGVLGADEIKFLRLGFSAPNPQVLHRVKKFQPLLESTTPLVLAMLRNFVKF